MSDKSVIRRFFTIDNSKFKNARQQRLLLVDIFMLILVVINLSFFLFQYSFGFKSFNNLILWLSPIFHSYYTENIYSHFEFIDLCFVAVFIVELLIRWGLAIYRKTYNKWFFYPFVHWYDTVGCIPMSGAMKFLRLFRVFSMLYRFQRLGIVDFSSTHVYRLFLKYLNILVEEVSDRVVANVIETAQREVKKDNPLADKIVREVLKPREEILVDYASKTVSSAVTSTYYNRRDELNIYLRSIITKAVDENREVKTIALIPGVGKPITQLLDSAIHNITFNVIDNMMEDLAKHKDNDAIRYIIDNILDSLEHNDSIEESQLKSMTKTIIIDVLEMIKQQVLIKDWQAKEMEEKANRLHKDLKKRMHELEE